MIINFALNGRWPPIEVLIAHRSHGIAASRSNGISSFIRITGRSNGLAQP